MVDVAVAPQANVSLSNIRFKLGSTELLDETSVRQLDQLAAALKDLAGQGGRFLIEGHTCSKGDAERNDSLSYDRAEKVRGELIAKGVPASSLKAIGCGEAEAARAGVSNSSDEVVLGPYRKVMVHALAE